MVVNVTFLLSIDSQIVSLLHRCFIQIGGFTVEVFKFELHHYFRNVFVNFLNEGSNSFGFWIKFIETSEMSDKFDELIMNLPLIFRFFLFFGNLLVENLEEFRFQEHFMKSDEDFEDEFKYLR